jgi:hypothetical protein
MKPKYSSPRKKADFTREERKLELELLREARELCDPDYASRAAGFWLKRLPAPEMRAKS